MWLYNEALHWRAIYGKMDFVKDTLRSWSRLPDKWKCLQSHSDSICCHWCLYIDFICRVINWIHQRIDTAGSRRNCHHFSVNATPIRFENISKQQKFQYISFENQIRCRWLETVSILLISLNQFSDTSNGISKFNLYTYVYYPQRKAFWKSIATAALFSITPTTITGEVVRI